MGKLIAAGIAALTLLAAPSASAAVSDVFGGDVSCAVQGDGTRFCGGSMTTTKTWDGVPIDVNVALPKEPSSGPDGNYPLVMLFHGYGGSKLGQSAMQRWVDKGYAAFSMSDRGFGDSCGSPASRLADPAGCATGYIRLLDTRYEVRDAQLFAGKLVDQGLVDPVRIGATGPSYGGGMSLALAALKNRTMMPDGSLVPWTSPGGTPLELAAAAPDIPWSDLGYALAPNGGTLDYVADSPYRGTTGVLKQSFVTGLYALGLATGYYATPGSDPDADVTGWFTRLNAGEPYAVNDILEEVTTHHSSYYIDHSIPPAPVLLTNGWTDDLFPVDEGVRFYNRTRQEYPDEPISLYFSDHGHQRGQNKAADSDAIEQAQYDWLDHYVLGSGPEPDLGVRALTQTCPGSAPSAGPLKAKSWAKLARGEVVFADESTKRVASSVSDPAGGAFDPVTGPGACATAPGDDIDGAATYRLPEAPDGGYTLLGSPTVIAEIKSSSENNQLAARLVDVGPGGEETLVARGLLRPPSESRFVEAVFQLHGNGWKFEAGHVPKLELLPADAPYGRPSNGQGEVSVSNLELRLPVHDKPGTGGVVTQRQKPVVPDGLKLSRDFKSLKRPNARVSGKTLMATGRKVKMKIVCPVAFVSCTGTTKLKGRGVSAKARFRTTQRHNRKVVKAKLSGKAIRALRRHPVKVTATTRTAEGVVPTRQRVRVKLAG